MIRVFPAQNPRHAFTLVELLVVIAIVGLLSTVAVVQMSGARAKARLAAGQSFDSSIVRSIGDQIAGEWLFEEASTTSAQDTSGFGKTGAVTGAVPVTGYNGKSALSFNGTSSYVNIPYGWTVTGRSFAVTAWVYDAGNGTNEIIFDASSGRISMQINNSTIACLTNNDAWRAGTSNTLPKNVWTHVACVFDSATGRLAGYINGAAAFQVADNAPAADPTQMRIGSNTNNAFLLTGYADDVRIYTASLSGAMIKKLYSESEKFYKNRRLASRP